MRTWRIHLSPRSTLSTPLQADTLFGHLCWAMVYRHGEERLAEFLAAFDEGLPLVLSDGLPFCPAIGDREEVALLPAPRFPLLSTEQMESLMADLHLKKTKADSRALIGCLKALKKLPALALDVFLGNREPLSPLEITGLLLEATVCPRDGAYNDDPVCPVAKTKDPWRTCPAFEGAEQKPCHHPALLAKTIPVMGITVDRWHGGTVQGALFSQSRTFPPHDFAIYCRLDESVLTVDELRGLLGDICIGGVGRDKSTGSGAMDLRGMELVPDLDEPVEGANAVLSLSSSYVPGESDPTDGWTDVHVKRGKLGGHLVHELRAWKRPVLMQLAGSLFRTDGLRPGYGGLVRGVHAEDDRIVQYGGMLGLPCRVEWPEQEAVREVASA